jgi:hypothetical protein
MAKKKATATKKPTTAKKKPATASRKTTTAKKKPATAKKKPTTASRKTATAKKPPVSERQRARTTFDFTTAPKEIQELTAFHEPHIELLPQQTIQIIMSEINAFMREFSEWSENNLTLTQRRRKIGAGIRNYGFIEKVADLAGANPQYAQFFNPVDLRNAIKNVDMCRDLVLLLQGFQRMVSNSMLVYSDDAFTMSTIFYRMVQTMSRRGDPQAIQLFRTLSPFFERRRRATEEPTAKEIERDLHALLHGTADGKMLIENETPKTTKGVRKVVDEVSRGRAAIKETVQAEIKE